MLIDLGELSTRIYDIKFFEFRQRLPLSLANFQLIFVYYTLQ